MIIPLPENLKDAPYLSAEDLKELPDGSYIYVLWSGGNGWHRYFTRRIGDSLYAMTHEDCNYPISVWGHRELDHIGEPPLTAVKH